MDTISVLHFNVEPLLVFSFIQKRAINSEWLCYAISQNPINMYQSRVIPVLLCNLEGSLVKTQKFKKPVYVGDPVNAVKIFNDKEVAELIFLDITATAQGRRPRPAGG
jgi:cyclase